MNIHLPSCLAGAFSGCLLFLTACSSRQALHDVPANTGPYPQMDLMQTSFVEDLGWCWYQDPRVIIHNGKLIIGGISGQSGDIRVGVFDLAGGKLDGVAVLDAAFEIDDHNGPVFHVRDDGSLVAVWAEHGKEDKHYYAISSKDNYLSWSERKVMQHDFVKDPDNYWGGVTYMNLYSIKKQHRLYNFFRMGSDLNPYFVYSEDDGATWGHRSHFVADEFDVHQRPYMRYNQVNDNLIGLFFSDAHPRQYGNSVYYAGFDGEAFYKADGSLINYFSDGPLVASDTDKIYQGSETTVKPEGFGSVPNAAWSTDVESDKNEHPHVAYSLYLSNSDQRFRMARWTGSAWHDREVAYAGPSLYEMEASYTGLIALDPEDPENVVISTNVHPNTGDFLSEQYEIYIAKVKEADDVSSIDWQSLTQNSSEKNFRPIIVSAEGWKVVLWMQGEFPHFEDFNTRIVGHILERP
ncbi:BNR-4 repeat-containing protein [Agaribacterium haliotis]|uniref:BNR-4 repeat-containing protein n=1 Tax=Agaribacterium haliotis TaxID=2013869 RepID=UPI000BB55D89|nr:BNR-4 repeat-containing protein [Agaribacterium haliotis]